MVLCPECSVIICEDIWSLLSLRFLLWSSNQAYQGYALLQFFTPAVWLVVNPISLLLFCFVCFPHFSPWTPLLWSHCCQVSFVPFLIHFLIFVTFCLAFPPEFYHHLLLSVPLFPESVYLGFHIWGSFKFFTLMINCLVLSFVCSVATFTGDFLCRNVSLFFPTYLLRVFLDDYYTYLKKMLYCPKPVFAGG